ncbi:MAG: AtpZ/AtpI family protein [Actinomycetota bacterium]
MAGVLAWGGIGWLLDRWLGTRFLVAVGILLGMVGAFYLIIKRYGSG